MLSSKIEKDFANYADDTTGHTCNLKMEKVIEILAKNTAQLSELFCNKFLKASPEKYHFLRNNSEKTAINKSFE